jgi:hypothetical protein
VNGAINGLYGSNVTLWVDEDKGIRSWLSRVDQEWRGKDWSNGMLGCLGWSGMC